MDQPIDIMLKIEEHYNIATGQEVDFTTYRLLNYLYFENNYQVIVIDLSRQEISVADCNVCYI